MGNSNPVTRAVTAAATMGLSETVRAGMDLAKGKDPLKAAASAGTLGATEVVPGVMKTANADLVDSVPLPDTQAITDKVSSLVSDTANPLDKIKRRSKTLLTGGLGVPGEASVVRKTLLGG